MLIDRTHLRWALVTAGLTTLAVGLRIYLGWDRPGGLTGGTAAGLWFGVAASALMIYAGLLSAHRRLGTITWLPIRRWLGTRKTWLRAHIWLGTLSAVLIYCHAGPRLGGPLEQVLWVLLIITILSGIYGLVVQAILPRRMTVRIAFEAPYEQIPHLCLRMRQEVDSALAEVLAMPQVEEPVGAAVRGLHETVRAFLAESYDSRSPLADSGRAEALFGRVQNIPALATAAEQLERMKKLCDERRQLAEQVRLHRWMHGWLLVHIPVTVALLILGVVHAVMSVYW